MSEALSALARGDAQQPLRLVFRPVSAAGLMAAMPAYRGGSAPAFGLKAVGIFPGNAERGQDTHQGAVALFDGVTGELRALMNAAAVDRDTHRGGLARWRRGSWPVTTRATWPSWGPASQARTHLRALACVRKLRRVRVASRRAESARRFAEEATQCPRHRRPGRGLGRGRGESGRPRGDRDRRRGAGGVPGVGGGGQPHQCRRREPAHAARARLRHRRRRPVLRRSARVRRERGRRLPDPPARGSDRRRAHPGRDRGRPARAAPRAARRPRRSRSSSRSASPSKTWPRPPSPSSARTRAAVGPWSSSDAPLSSRKSSMRSAAQKKPGAWDRPTKPTCPPVTHHLAPDVARGGERPAERRFDGDHGIVGGVHDQGGPIDRGEPGTAARAARSTRGARVAAVGRGDGFVELADRAQPALAARFVEAPATGPVGAGSPREAPA